MVAAALRRQQVHLYIYLDDWLIVGPTRHSTLEALTKTIQLTIDLGFIYQQLLSLEPPSIPLWAEPYLPLENNSGGMCASLPPEVGFVCWVSCQVWWTLFPGAGCIFIHFNSISSIITAHVRTLLPNKSQ